jgi:SAM-dependent methyltransferase
MPPQTEANVVGSAHEYNKIMYEAGWHYYTLQPHTIWSAWKEIEPFAGEDKRLLEIGPGKFPHLPVHRSHFIDLSINAIEALRAAGGVCMLGDGPLPYEDASFDLACFFELIEHVDDDVAFLAEVARVVRPGGVIFLGCPMNPTYWTHYDKFVGHVRRYRAQELAQRLDAAGFTIERVCARKDRMSRAYGFLFACALFYLPRFTTMLIRLALPSVAGRAWKWVDGDSLQEAERKGGVTLRARRRNDAGVTPRLSSGPSTPPASPGPL